MDEWGWTPENRARAIASFESELATQPDQSAKTVARLLQQRRKRMLAARVETIFATFGGMTDHGMRCGIAAMLFASNLYADAHYLAISGASEEEIDRARPSLTILKRQVAAYFADWLTQPLVTRQRPGKTAIADLSRLLVNYGTVEPICKNAYDTCRALRKISAPNVRDQWRSTVRSQWTEMPEDLIECLQPKMDWSKELRNKIGRHLSLWKSDPEIIAREWAARKCNAPDFSYSPTTLAKRLKEQEPKTKSEQRPKKRGI